MRQITFRHTKTNGMLVLVFAASAMLLAVAGLHNAGASYVQDCKPNSIIVCGVPTSDAFISDVRANSDGHGNNDLRAVYQDFGLVPSDYDKFVTSARPGMAYQNGTIVVDGKTVATNAWSIGRTRFSYTTPMTINGKTYYKAKDSQVLLQNLPVMVMFDGKGQMQFAVMNACGNPVTGQKVIPKYSCDLLQASPASGRNNTYDFTTQATATNNANLVSVTYTFGDGTSATETDLSTPVRHTYIANTCMNNGNTCTAMATITVSLPGNQTVTTTSATCQKQIQINEPKPPTPPPVTASPTALPSTGAGSVIGLFVLTSAGGYYGYRLYVRRRLSRSL